MPKAKAKPKRQTEGTRSRVRPTNNGEYKKQGLVTVEMNSFEAELFAPEKLREVERTRPGILAQGRSDIVEEKYIVTARRIESTWEYTIDHDGKTSGYRGRSSTASSPTGKGSSPKSGGTQATTSYARSRMPTSRKPRTTKPRFTTRATTLPSHSRSWGRSKHPTKREAAA